MTTTSRSSTAIGNPGLPAAQPHLCIGKKIICQNVRSTLRWTVSTPDYRKDLQKKHHWSMSDFENVSWDSFHAALKSFRSEDQRQIILFVNDKPPSVPQKPTHTMDPHYVCPANASLKLHRTSLHVNTMNGTNSSMPSRKP